MRAERLILLAILTVLRDRRRNPEKCRARVVGRIRDIVGAPKVIVIGEHVPEEVAAQRDACEILAKHCRKCGRCELARA